MASQTVGLNIRHRNHAIVTTHDEGGIAEKDFSLAKLCNEVFSKF